MSEVTGQDHVRAALHRLRARDGYSAVEALLNRVGVTNANHVPDEAFDEIMAACPELKPGEGIMVGAGDGTKPKGVRETINDMGADRNAKAAAKPKENIGDALKATLEGEDGFNNAARALNARDGGPMKSAKTK